MGVENVRGNDEPEVLTNFCFMQYNIGRENEYSPQEWKVRVTILNFLAVQYCCIRCISPSKIIQ